MLCEHCTTDCPITGTAPGETALDTTGIPPPGEPAGFVLVLLTGELFTSLGSLGLLCKIPELLVASVSTALCDENEEFVIKFSPALRTCEVPTLRRVSSFEENCSWFDSVLSLCGCKSFTLSANTICTCCSSVTGELTIRGSSQSESFDNIRMVSLTGFSGSNVVLWNFLKCLFLSGNGSVNNKEHSHR